MNQSITLFIDTSVLLSTPFFLFSLLEINPGPQRFWETSLPLNHTSSRALSSGYILYHLAWTERLLLALWFSQLVGCPRSCRHGLNSQYLRFSWENPSTLRREPLSHFSGSCPSPHPTSPQLWQYHSLHWECVFQFLTPAEGAPTAPKSMRTRTEEHSSEFFLCVTQWMTVLSFRSI